MHKFFSYFNTLTGTREISDTNRWTIGFNQVRTQGDTLILPQIKSTLDNLNQKTTDINYLLGFLDKNSTEHNKHLDFLLTESDFVKTGIENIYISIFNEPFALLQPTLKVDQSVSSNIYELLRTIYLDIRCELAELEKKVNIAGINRLITIMNRSITNILDRLEALA